MSKESKKEETVREIISVKNLYKLYRVGGHWTALVFQCTRENFVRSSERPVPENRLF